MSELLNCAVEGITDEAAARKLAHTVGFTQIQVFPSGSKRELRGKVPAYHSAAAFAPWLVLIDLDHDAACAPAAKEMYTSGISATLGLPPPKLCLRVIVRSLEAWLLADRESLAEFLQVRIADVPKQPEQLDRPKLTLIQLAQRSTRKEIANAMAPRQGSGREVGPNYAARLVAYMETAWQPRRAAVNSESLRRALRCLDALAAGIR